MIIASRWVGGRLVVGLCIQWNPGKNLFGVVILPVHFGRDLICYSNFNFSYIDNKELLFLKIYKYYNFKQNKPRAYCNFIKYFFYLIEVAADVPKKHLSC